MSKPNETLSSFLDMLFSVTKPLIAFYLDEAIRIKEGRSDLSISHIQMYANSLTILTGKWRSLGTTREGKSALMAKDMKVEYEKCLRVQEDLQQCFIECVLVRIETSDEDEILRRIIDQNNWTRQNAKA